MKFLWIAAILLCADMATAQATYDRGVVRSHPARSAGLSPDGQSMTNFAKEGIFGIMLRDFFGFNDKDVSEAKVKAAAGNFTLWQLAPGSRFDDMCGGTPIKSVGPGRTAFWLEYYRLEVSSGKVARFVTICANGIKLSKEGTQIKPHAVVVTRDVPRDVIRDVPGENVYVFQYEERVVEVPGPERVEYIDRPILVPVAPLYGEGPRTVGSHVVQTYPVAFVGYTFRSSDRAKCRPQPRPRPRPTPPGCTPGVIPPGPPIRIGPPNPQDPNQGLGPAPPIRR
ncbi:MAG: IMCp domain-containing protein [Patescibacteria group bacterium]|jgi:hypothetical protein